jgi:hypothetical protein
MSLLREYIQSVLTEAPKYKPYAWTPWSPESQQVQYKPMGPGIGPGEDRLAVQLDGKVQGGNVTYDIVDAEGRKWEVKEPGKAWMIRVMSEGRVAIADTRAAIDEANRNIVQGFSKLTAAGLDVESMFTEDAMQLIAKYITNDVPMMTKGEIPKGRANRLHAILTIIHEITKGEEGESLSKTVEMGDEEHTVKATVDLKTYIRLGNILQMDRSELRVEDDQILAAAFNEDPFKDPDRFMDTYWTKAATASEVFGHTSGLILVHPEGFRVIPLAGVDKEVTFSHISQGVPFFKVVRELN